MGRRHHSRSYNATPETQLPPPPDAPTAAALPLNSPISSLLSILAPPRSTPHAPITLPSLPVGELLGGVSNTVRGLVLNENWWVALLIIFLFFPNISSKMFGGVFKD